MIKFAAALKWALGILFGFGAMTAMAYYANPGASWSLFEYPQSIYDYFWKKPAAPVIVDQYPEGGCGARVHWSDYATDEDGVYFYRRVQGEANFNAVKITLPHPGIPGSFDDANLPPGTYEYRVSVFNQYGETFSNISDPVTVDNQACADNQLLIKPLNPLIVDAYVVNGCTIRLEFEDNSLDEDGLRIYRWSYVDGLPAVIDELGPHAGVPGTYDDASLPPTTYTYQISVFNANGESFSNVTDDLPITDPNCEPIPVVDPGDIQLAPTATPHFMLKACIWKAGLNVFVRTGPGASQYPDMGAVEGGTELEVVGQSEDEFFWAVKLASGDVGYIPKADRFGMVNGDCDVPVLPDPEVPEVDPAAPQCSDGIDNDGDRRIDYVAGTLGTGDRECTSPDDNSEN